MKGRDKEEDKDIEEEEDLYEDKDKEEDTETESSYLLNKSEDTILQNYDFKDVLLLTDLDLFYKTGKLPYIFITHLISTLMVAIIVLS